MKIAISLDSACDLTEDLIKKFDFKVIPFNIQLGDKSMFDGETSLEEMFEFVETEGQLPKTSAINEYHYQEHFKKILNEGYDGVIHISISSKLSSTFSNSERAAAELKNVYVIDSLSLSTGIALSAIYCYKLLNEDKLDVAEVIKKVNNRKQFVQASFTLEKVNYLYKGGRCSLLSFLGANLLRIRPQIIVKDGVMVVGKKFRGPLSLVINKYVESTLQEFSKPDRSMIFITYTTCNKEDIDRIYNRLKEYGFKEIYITRAHATVSTHCGPNCLGILYFNDFNKN